MFPCQQLCLHPRVYMRVMRQNLKNSTHLKCCFNRCLSSEWFGLITSHNSVHENMTAFVIVFHLCALSHLLWRNKEPQQLDCLLTVCHEEMILFSWTHGMETELYSHYFFAIFKYSTSESKAWGKPVLLVSCSVTFLLLFF